jgi:hypothetical protein
MSVYCIPSNTLGNFEHATTTIIPSAAATNIHIAQYTLTKRATRITISSGNRRFIYILLLQDQLLRTRGGGGGNDRQLSECLSLLLLRSAFF